MKFPSGESSTAHREIEREISSLELKARIQLLKLKKKDQNHQMANLKSWVLAARPKTLTAALIPVIVGTCLAKMETGNVIWWVSVLTLLASFFIQIGTNFVNDAMDFKKGADTETRIGPQRMTQAGAFTEKQVMAMAGFFFGLAVLCGIPLVIQGGVAILGIGLISVAMGYAYTAGPFPLAYKGLGDLFVIIFFGLIAVGGVYYLHTGSLSTGAIFAGLQVGLHCTVLIAVNNLRDHAGDRLVGKKTLPVRFGKRFARWEIAVLCFSPFLLGLYWMIEGRFGAFLLPFLILPMAMWISKLVFETEPSPAYNKFLGKAAGLHLVFGSLLSMGFFL
ncbi:MAG: 1,4-dihydroxy-2-naphthoate polyprenyltransferase [Pseudobdellovibrionaceae bacterium]